MRAPILGLGSGGARMGYHRSEGYLLIMSVLTNLANYRVFMESTRSLQGAGRGAAMAGAAPSGQLVFSGSDIEDFQWRGFASLITLSAGIVGNDGDAGFLR